MELWADTMMTEERGFAAREPEPVRVAAATFTAFVAVGSCPSPRTSTTGWAATCRFVRVERRPHGESRSSSWEP